MLSRLDGWTEIITIHPPLQPSKADAVGELAEWQDVLGRLVNECVRRFREQCPARAFSGPPDKAAVAPRRSGGFERGDVSDDRPRLTRVP
jgi:hypothetical protein